MICEKHPALLDKTPLEVQRKKIETAAGNFCDRNIGTAVKKGAVDGRKQSGVVQC